VPRGVDNEITRQLEVEVKAALHADHVLNDGALGEIGSTDLLCNTTSFACLNISSSKFVENECFASVDVAENTENGASERDCMLLLLLGLHDFLLSGLLLSLEFSQFLLPLLL
jgi:hypothetical protein